VQARIISFNRFVYSLVVATCQLATDYENATRRVAILIAQNEALSVLNAKLNAENAALRTDNQDLHGGRAVVNAEIEALRTENQALNDGRALLNAETEALSTEIRVLNFETQALRLECEQVMKPSCHRSVVCIVCGH
jgi:cell division protein FtsB